MGPVTLAAIPPSNSVESRVHGLEPLCQVTYEILTVSKKFPNIHALAQAAVFPGCPASPTCLFSVLRLEMSSHIPGVGVCALGESLCLHLHPSLYLKFFNLACITYSTYTLETKEQHCFTTFSVVVSSQASPLGSYKAEGSRPLWNPFLSWSWLQSVFLALSTVISLRANTTAAWHLALCPIGKSAIYSLCC